MQIKPKLQKIAELSVGLAFITTLILAGCGGGGGSSTTGGATGGSTTGGNAGGSAASGVGGTTGGSAVPAVGTQQGGARQGIALNIAAGSGVVSTLAGDSSFGGADGTGTAASFWGPAGVTTDGSNLYVSDMGNNTIRKVEISTGQVTTLAGSRWASASSVDGVGTAASFNYPDAITTDGINLYVVDRNIKIRKIVISTREVTTLAGSGSSGSADGLGNAATFNTASGLVSGGLTTDGTYLYVADAGNKKIRKVEIATGQVTTLAGTGTTGVGDGVGTAASFSGPTGITTDGTNLYVGDGANLRKIVLATREVTTLATGLSGLTSLSTDGSYLYVVGSADPYTSTIRKIAIAGLSVSTLAGGPYCGGGYSCGFGLDGTGTAAKFRFTGGITTDGVALYVTDRNGYYGNFIRKIK